MTRRGVLVSALLIGLLATVAPAKQDNIKPIPPLGITVPDADRTEIVTGIEALGKEIETLRLVDLKNRPELLRFLPDVQLLNRTPFWGSLDCLFRTDGDVPFG